MKNFMLILSLTPFFFACGDKGDANETTDSGNEEDDSIFNSSDPDEEVSEDAPTISNADAWCFVPGGSTEGEQWGFTFSFTDPQGIETVPRLQPGAIEILNSSGIVTNSIDPACSWDSGICTSYPFSTQVGTGCEGATTISAKFQIVDEDGNTSNSITLEGREGSDFDGQPIQTEDVKSDSQSEPDPQYSE